MSHAEDSGADPRDGEKTLKIYVFLVILVEITRRK